MCYGQQQICFGSIKDYSVDETENAGIGTLGSTYVWSVNNNFQGEITPNTSSGNQITIDWETTPAGNYQLKVEEINTFGCSSFSFMNIQIIPSPLVNLEDVIVCVDDQNNWTSTAVLHTNLSTSLFTFEWFLNGNLLPNTNNSLIPTQLGTYKVIVTSNTNGCKSEDSAVVSSSPPIIALATLFTDFQFSQTIVIEASGGTPPYMYSLNGNTPQSSNIFSVNTAGKYNIIVTDETSCNIAEVCACVFKYDNYFTPNGDGVNDSWNILVPDDTRVMSVSIFDRYGKLLKQITPNGIGWDGKYNGKDLPSTDYWFSVEFMKQNNEKGIFKSHFTLKR